MTQLTGQLVAQRRAELKMSRDAFAQLVGMRPGAVWRVEVKGVFRPGEEEQIRRAAFGDQVSVETPLASAAPTEPSPPLEPSAVAVEVPSIPPPVAFSPVVAGPVGPPAPSGPVDVVVLTNVPEPRPPTPTEMSEKDGLRRISNSELATFGDCRRRWWLGYHRALTPRAAEDPVGAKHIGDRIHRALRRWYVPDGQVPVDPRDALEKLVQADRERLIARFSRFNCVVPPELMRKFDADANLERIMLDGYVEWLQETGADAIYRVVEPEAYLEAPLPGVPGVLIIARLDARVLRSTDGARLWLEHKTVGDLNTPKLTLHLDEQVLFQTLVESLQAGDQPRVVGALWTMMRRVKRTGAARPPFYERVEVHHNPVEVNSFTQRTVGKVLDMEFVQSALDEGADHRRVAYPRPTRDCSWKCPFLKVCGMIDDGSHAESMIEAHYTKGDPYSYYVSDTDQ